MDVITSINAAQVVFEATLAAVNETGVKMELPGEIKGSAAGEGTFDAAATSLMSFALAKGVEEALEAIGSDALKEASRFADIVFDEPGDQGAVERAASAAGASAGAAVGAAVEAAAVAPTTATLLEVRAQASEGGGSAEELDRTTVRPIGGQAKGQVALKLKKVAKKLAKKGLEKGLEFAVLEMAKEVGGEAAKATAQAVLGIVFELVHIVKEVAKLVSLCDVRVSA